MKKLYLMMFPNDCLVFDLASEDPASTTLHLKNTADHNVSFKVKTTAPKTYQVKPSQGILAPSEESKISLIMHTTEVNPDCSRDKFLVEATRTNLNAANPVSIAEELKKVPKEQIQRAKLNVLVNTKRAANRAGTVYINPVEPHKGSRVEEVSSNIKDLQKSIEEIDDENSTLEKKLREVQGNLRKKEQSFRAWNAESFKGFTILHVIVVLISGIIFGFLSAIHNRNNL